MAEEKRVPKIRFKGFDEEWELHNFTEITYPSGTKNKDNLPYESYSISNDAGFVPQDEYFENGGSMKDADKRMYFIVSPKSFIYNPARINIGSIGYQNLDKDVIVSSLYEIFKTTDGCNDTFLWYWFKTDNFKKLVQKLQEGGVRLYFYYDKLCAGHLHIPKINEQNKIADILSSLDSLITQTESKYESLQHLKETMLEKMFPKDGSDVPEIRFKGFSGKWTNYNFKELLSYLASNTLSRADLEYRDNGVYNIHYGDILVKYNEILNLDSTEVPVIKYMDYSISKSMQLMEGDIIIADTAEDETVGKCTELRNVKSKLIVSGLHTIPCRSKKQFASGYLGYYMNSPSYHNQLMVLMQGTKVASISKSGLSDSTQLSCPETILEQNKIAQFFDTINNRITHQNQELQKLRTLKKSLLEKMFVWYS